MNTKRALRLLAPPHVVSPRRDRPAVRNVLVLLLALGAVSAFGGGAYGLSGARGIPTQWLAGSPFRDYTIPSLILMSAVGGSMALAALALRVGWRSGRVLALAAGVIVFVWLAVQVGIIGYVSWLQPTTAIAGAAMVALAALLPHPVARGRA